MYDGNGAVRRRDPVVRDQLIKETWNMVTLIQESGLLISNLQDETCPAKELNKVTMVIGSL